MTTDEALAELRVELALWGDWHVTELQASRAWGSRDHDGQWKSDVGAWRTTYDDAWCVTAEQDGWDKENGRFFEWGKDIAEAALQLRDEMRHRREDPHYAHMADGWVVPHCDPCAGDMVTLDLVGLPRPIYVR